MEHAKEYTTAVRGLPNPLGAGFAGSAFESVSQDGVLRRSDKQLVVFRLLPGDALVFDAKGHEHGSLVMGQESSGRRHLLVFHHLTVNG